LYEVIFVAEEFPVFEIPAKSQIRSFQHEPPVGVRIRDAILFSIYYGSRDTYSLSAILLL